jgi:gliding motility-associated-like protein
LTDTVSIKELQNNIGWDGTFNGHELPATDYWFVVTRSNEKNIEVILV